MPLDNFSTFLQNISPDPIPVLDTTFSPADFKSINLSSNNRQLQEIDISNSRQLSNFIETYKTRENAKIAWGGYLETRDLYKRSQYFNQGEIDDERNIHLGIDLWSEADSIIVVPLDAKIHSFGNNTNFGDYGPTIILEHPINDQKFYTLYGHLSLDSIKNLNIGQKFNRGDLIGTLGDNDINGDYPPHLHFQVIKNMENRVGDYPGVCSKKDLAYYADNCPDPNLLLKLKP